MRTIFCLFLLMFSITAESQINQIRFHSVNTAGIGAGEVGVHGLFQTVNGLEYQKWFAGIGTGYDGYYYNSIPLFADVRRYLDAENKFIFYGDAGYNFPVKNTPKENSFYSSFNFRGGLYSDAGVGYKIKYASNKSFLLSCGYSYKRLFSTVSRTICPFVGPCYENTYQYIYNFNRMTLKAGIIL